MRVLRALAGGVLVQGVLLGAAPAGTAQPRGDLPSKLDVARALDVLADQQVYRAPGAVAGTTNTRLTELEKEAAR